MWKLNSNISDIWHLPEIINAKGKHIALTAEPTHVYLGEVKLKPWAAYVTLTCPTYANQAE